MNKMQVLKLLKVAGVFILAAVISVCSIPQVTAQESAETELAAASEPVQTAEATPDNDSALLYISHDEDGDTPVQQVTEISVEGEGDEYDSGEAPGNEGVLALWINGERVVQTPAQVAAWEKGLYACQSEEEYNAYLANVAYYNKGVDMDRFEWAWDQMREIYTEEQIVLLKQNSNAKKRMPDAVGMTAEQAYRMFTDKGFIVRLSYQYSATATVPVGTCYAQEIPAGTLHRLGETFFIWIQAEKPRTKVIMPSLVGKTEGEIRQQLSNLGFTNVDYQYEYSDSAMPAGSCIGQSAAAGSTVWCDDYIVIVIKLEPVPIETPSTLPEEPGETPSEPPTESPSADEPTVSS